MFYSKLYSLSHRLAFVLCLLVFAVPALTAPIDKGQREIGEVYIDAGLDLDRAHALELSGTQILNVTLSVDGSLESCKSRTKRNDIQLAEWSCEILMQRAHFEFDGKQRKYYVISAKWPSKKQIDKAKKEAIRSNFDGGYPISAGQWYGQKNLDRALRLTKGKVILPIDYSADEKGNITSCTARPLEGVKIWREKIFCEKIIEQGRLVPPLDKFGKPRSSIGTLVVRYRDPSASSPYDREACQPSCTFQRNSNK